MKRFHISVLIAMLAAPLPGAAGSGGDCAGAPGIEAMVTCAEAADQKADQRLNRSYAAARQALDAGDGAKLLLDAQRAWLKFRDADCRVVANQAHGGLLSRFLWSACRADLTEARSTELDAQAKGLGE
ncbi:MAG: lysozyme inhibitor LprI family protein [Rhodospirillaceae bacterium]